MSDAVKELVRKAIIKTKETHATLSLPSTEPESEGSKAIARLAIVTEGRLEALEEVYDAMTGNKFKLRWRGSNG